jgi:hypothetical protein
VAGSIDELKQICELILKDSSYASLKIYSSAIKSAVNFAEITKAELEEPSLHLTKENSIQSIILKFIQKGSFLKDPSQLVHFLKKQITSIVELLCALQEAKGKSNSVIIRKMV